MIGCYLQTAEDEQKCRCCKSGEKYDLNVKVQQTSSNSRSVVGGKKTLTFEPILNIFSLGIIVVF